MDKSNKGKSNKQVIKANPLEALKDIGKSTSDQMKHEASKLPEDFMEQLLGIKTEPKNFSGEIYAGGAIEISEVISGQHEEIIEHKHQSEFLLQLEREEKSRIDKKSNELRVRIKALQVEILAIAQKTQSLGEETQLAAMQAPVKPGEYHLIFFEKLLEFIISFRKKIEEAGVWLHAVNKRVAQKNAWGANYKKHGAKYLLSGEHYISRSAG